jgi:hypothetical protein
VINILVSIAGFFIPSELIWSMGASGIIKSYLGANYVFVQPQFFILLGTILYIISIDFYVKKTLLFPCMAFLSIGIYEYLVTVVLGENIRWALQQFFLGFLIPVMTILFLAATTPRLKDSFFRWFYLGYCAYLLLAIFLLLFIDQIFFAKIESQGIGAALLSMRYSSLEQNWFAVILGNANKQSNYLLLCLLLGPQLMSFEERRDGVKKRLDLLIYRSFALLSIFVLFILFSRAAILLLPVALYLNRHYFFAASKNILIGLIFGIFILISIYFEEIVVVLNYLLFSDYIDGTSRGALGTFDSRLVQWSAAASQLVKPEVLLHGLGVGAFGKLIDCEQCGTHNLFLDHWFASGVFGVFILISIIIFCLISSYNKRNYSLMYCCFCFVAVALREYSFSFLYVTSMGGFVFLFLIFSVVFVSRKSISHGRSGDE